MTSQFHEFSHGICGGFLLFGTSQVGVTAIQVFSEHGLNEGQRVLVIGASGGVGHIATQASEQKNTVFPHIVSAETILFLIWKSNGHNI